MSTWLSDWALVASWAWHLAVLPFIVAAALGTWALVYELRRLRRRP